MIQTKKANSWIRGGVRVGWFSLSVLITGAASLASIPFVILHAGSDGWAAIAVGQSLGAVTGIFTMLGWLQSGPSDIARSIQRGNYFFDSLYIRLASLVVTVPMTFAAANLLGTSDLIACFLSACSMLMINTGASWFYVGEANPRGLFLFDALPRAAGVLCATIILGTGARASAYSATVLFFTALAVAFSVLDIGHRYGFARPNLRPTHIFLTVRRHRHGIATALLSAVYLSLPLLVVQLIVPSTSAIYALADKLKQQALTIYRPFSQVLQGWTPTPDPTETAVRVRRAQLVILIMGMVCGLGFFIVSPLLSRVLSAGQLDIGLQLWAPVALAFGMNVISLSIGVGCLVPLGLERHITISATLGMISGALLVVPSAYFWSIQGVAWAVAISQLLVAGYQIIISSHHLNRPVPVRVPSPPAR